MPKCSFRGKRIRQRLNPVTPEITTSQSDAIRHLSRPPHYDYNHLLRQPNDLPECPSIVETWCINCKEATETSHEPNNIVTDRKPRWSLGYSRPLYVERIPKCLNCLRTNRSPGRFVPKDIKIFSISPQRLVKFGGDFDQFGQELQRILLDEWPPSSKSPKP